MKRHVGKVVGSVGIVWMLMAVGAAVAGPVTFEWDWPTNLVGGAAMPVELKADLRGVLYLQRLGVTNWTESATTQTYTNRMTVDVPVGAWLCAVAAQFGTNVATRSEMSSNITHKAYGRLVAVGNLRVLVVTE